MTDKWVREGDYEYLSLAPGHRVKRKWVEPGTVARETDQLVMLIAALERARDYIDDCGAQAGAQAAIDDIEAVLAQVQSDDRR